uniref:ATP--guanido phosphotransferase n=1 Tax=Dictyoglomus turgidum TaxID=513050 RepID=A0A7C3WUS3_9BACT
MREFYYKYLKWLGEDNLHKDIILSTRIRLARNVSEFPFPNQASEPQRKRFINKVEWVFENDSNFNKDYDFLRLEKLPRLVSEVLIEKHLISEDQFNNLPGTGLIVKKDGKLSIRLNEEDHFRLQVLSGGLEIDESWKMLQSLENHISEYFDFAFDNSMGYLTSCITNLGCGLRISFLVHLPALTYTGKIKNLFRRLRSSKVLIRGFYGENTEAVAGFYQIASRSSLGYSEEELLRKMEEIALKIVNEEIKARELLFEERRRWVEDIVGRAWGIINFAKYVESLEAISLLSDIRFGIFYKIINLPIKLLDLLLILTLPAHLQVKMGREMDPEERDRVRADLLHDVFKNYKID